MKVGIMVLSRTKAVLKLILVVSQTMNASLLVFVNLFLLNARVVNERLYTSFCPIKTQPSLKY